MVDFEKRYEEIKRALQERTRAEQAGIYDPIREQEVNHSSGEHQRLVREYHARVSRYRNDKS